MKEKPNEQIEQAKKEFDQKLNTDAVFAQRVHLFGALGEFTQYLENQDFVDFAKSQIALNAYVD
jgi:hypothetical protein